MASGLISQENFKIDYVELPVTDIERTKTFFGGAFGWTFTDFGENYCEFCDGRIKGGFARVDEVSFGGPMVVLYHDDLPEAQNRILAAGGTIIKETFSFPGGERFEFSDLEGHVWAVWRVNGWKYAVI